MIVSYQLRSNSDIASLFSFLNRKLSLNYLQLQTSRLKSYKDDYTTRRKSRKRGFITSYDSDDSMSEQRSLSKNDINAIRRSQVDSLHQSS